MDSNNQLVNYLINNGVLKTPLIIDAFINIDRKNFVLQEYIEQSYENKPLPIGYGQTISQPYTVAFMIELLCPKKGDKILDIGSGSGWTSALLAFIVGESGGVKGYEIIPELIKFGNNNIQKFFLKNVYIYQSEKNFNFIKGQYDKILVSASTSEIPKDLIKKLKVGGIMVIPINDYIYQINKINKKGDVNIMKYYGFIFVPLILDEKSGSE